LTYKKAEEIVNIVLDTMSETLVEGGRIEIRGFGSLVVKDYKAYIGRNPKTGEEIEVKPKKLPFFKVGKELRERINKR
jgi:integration host factor subunit beta